MRLRAGATNLPGENIWKAQISEEFSPQCECGETEDARHVLLHCMLLAEDREIMEHAVRNIISRANLPRNLQELNWWRIMGGAEDEVSRETQEECDRVIATFLLSSGRNF